jgi:hypothetical protein
LAGFLCLVPVSIVWGSKKVLTGMSLRASLYELAIEACVKKFRKRRSLKWFS